MAVVSHESTIADDGVCPDIHGTSKDSVFQYPDILAKDNFSFDGRIHRYHPWQFVRFQFGARALSSHYGCESRYSLSCSVPRRGWAFPRCAVTHFWSSPEGSLRGSILELDNPGYRRRQDFSWLQSLF